VQRAEYISDLMLLIPAYAKINLCLAVLGRRPDGFHEIDSVAVTVDWHDLVGVAVSPARRTVVRLRLTGTGDAPADEGNLASRAAQAVASLSGPAEVDLWLDKRLPTQAGLGGGSSDAAAVIRATASGLALSPAVLDGVAASLGSDVPMLLAGGAQRVRGRGERLTPLALPTLHLAVAVAGRSGTAATYAATTPADFEDGLRVEEVLAALAAGSRPVDETLGSGLEAPACRAHPALGERLQALRRAMPGTGWHLTGSGGAAFALAAGATEAAALAADAAAHGLASRACRTVG
jgi:4-diphosphocytidyl-2-C-methyl-D-erythritol kinase